MLLLGCGVPPDGTPQPVAATPAAASSAVPAAAPAPASSAAPTLTPAQPVQLLKDAPTLARIEFPEGNVVTFKQIGSLVLIGESGSAPNPPRYHQADPNERPTDAFRRLAPGTEVPPALLDAERAAHVTAQSGQQPQVTVEKGHFEGSQPDETNQAPLSSALQDPGGSCSSSWFNSAVCGFPSGPSGQGPPKDIWRLYDWWNGAYENANASWGYHAACADIGDILLSVNVANVGSYQQTIFQGDWYYWSWWAGNQCFTTCYFWSCFTGCENNVVYATSNILNATNKRFHYCGYYDWFN
jgi:hypothetical protein